MNNSGKITVFLCLIISSMLLVSFTVNKIITSLSVKEKAVICAKSAISDIKAEYNTYIFEHYHILLFDKSYGGKGEAYLEQKLHNNMCEKMGERVSVEQTAITNFRYIYEEDCMPFQEQIADYLKYAAIENGIDKIVDETKGEDGTLPETVTDDIKAQGQTENGAEENQDEIQTQSESQTQDENKTQSGMETEGNINEMGETPQGNKKEEDPRKYTAKAGIVGIVTIIKPSDMEISGAYIDLSECFSKKQGKAETFAYKVNTRFDDCDDMLADMKKHESWADKLVSSGVGAVYAVNVFNCAVDTSVNETSVLKYELEYLACGKKSDAENLERAVERIVLIRFPINYSYLISDTTKMARVTQIAIPISVATLIPEPVVKTLIAGCWSYAEAMADARVLLQGKKLPFAKSKESWITDIDRIGESVCEGTGSDSGMSYQDYLMILLSMNADKTYYRMLDLIDINARSVDEDFDIANGVVALTAEFIISYDDKNYYIKESGGY
ncbi:MAG: DUF5702 domain-containing protein [Clostridium sp.]|nr:DUF5702 domain-containing protein [Clostridium sp.]